VLKEYLIVFIEEKISRLIKKKKTKGKMKKVKTRTFIQLAIVYQAITLRFFLYSFKNHFEALDARSHGFLFCKESKIEK
jgi:plasmid maintenance system killer protein